MAIPRDLLAVPRGKAARPKREGPDYGPSILGSELRYLSTSQLDKADENVYGGCPRRWWLRYKARRPEPEFASQTLGTLVHAQVEHHLRTGEDVLGELARSGRRFIPRWNDDGKLRVEYGFASLKELEPAGSYGPILSPLTVHGVPFVGFMDLLSERGEWLDDEGVLRQEPGVPEVVDWKTTAQIDTKTNEKTGRVTRGYAKTAEELASGWQMTTYDFVALDLYPDAPAVRDSHGYFQTRGAREASKRSKLVPADEIRARRGKLEDLVAKMQAWARCDDAKDVPAAMRGGKYIACEAYRGCPYKDECPRDPKIVLASRLGAGAAGRLTRTDKEKELHMSLLDRVKKNGAAAKPAPAKDPAVEAEKAALLAEEAGINPPDRPAPRATHEPIPEGSSVVVPDRPLNMKVEAACGHAVPKDQTSTLPDGTIKHVGCPGAAKESYTAAADPPKQKAPEATSGGGPGELCPISGTQVDLTIDDVASKAKDCVCGATVKKVKAQKMGDGTYVAVMPKHMVPGEPEAEVPSPATCFTTTPEQSKQRLAETSPLPAAKVREIVEEAKAAAAKVEGTLTFGPLMTRAVKTDAVDLYLDSCEDGIHAQPLSAYVAALCRELEAEYKVVDVRAASEGPLSFGKWVGILAAFVRAQPPAPGAYYASAGDATTFIAFNELAAMKLGRVVRKS